MGLIGSANAMPTPMLLCSENLLKVDLNPSFGRGLVVNRKAN